MIIRRYTHDNISEWLKVKTITKVTVIEAKKFSSHGNVVRNGSEGNGYHGCCSNCGLALVTDLGYNSWSDTPCEIKANRIVDTSYKLTWQKSPLKATELSDKEANKHFTDLVREQGWGKYNFQITNFTAI